MTAGTVLGVLYAAASAFFNGSFGAFAKAEPIKRARVSPLHFNFWVSVGLIVSTLPLLANDRVRLLTAQRSSCGHACQARLRNNCLRITSLLDHIHSY